MWQMKTTHTFLYLCSLILHNKIPLDEILWRANSSIIFFLFGFSAPQKLDLHASSSLSTTQRAEPSAAPSATSAATSTFASSSKFYGLFNESKRRQETCCVYLLFLPSVFQFLCFYFSGSPPTLAHRYTHTHRDFPLPHGRRNVHSNDGTTIHLQHHQLCFKFG